MEPSNKIIILIADTADDKSWAAIVVDNDPEDLVDPTNDGQYTSIVADAIDLDLSKLGNRTLASLIAEGINSNDDEHLGGAVVCAIKQIFAAGVLWGRKHRKPTDLDYPHYRHYTERPPEANGH